MDHSADFDCAVEGMEWEDVLSTLQAAVSEILGDTPSPPPPSPPPSDPAGLIGFDTHPQLVESLSGGYGGYVPLGAAPHTFEQPSPVMATPGLNVGQAAPIMYQGPLYDQNVMQSGHLYSQAGAYSQGQYLPYQWPVDDVPRAAAASYPVAPPHPAVVGELLGDTPSPPSPSPPPLVPAGLVGYDTHPQPVESLSGGYGWYVPLGAAPHTFEQPSPVMATPGLNPGQAAPIMYQGPLYDQNVTQSGHLYSQAGAYSQGQYLPYQWPVDDVPRAAAASYPVAPPHPAVVGELLGDTPSPPSPSPPPLVPAGLVGYDTHPQPVEGLSGGYGWYVPLGAAPHTFEQPSPVMATPGLNAGQAAPIMYQGPLYDQNVTQSGHLYSQAGAYSQGQYLPYQWPVDGIPRAAAASYPVAPPHPYNHVPVVRLPEGMDQNLTAGGVLNGEVVYRIAADVFAPSYSAAPPLNTSVSKKRKRDNQQHEDRLYVKKPPNAFMLFMKEQRPNVVAGFNVSDSALVNTMLGQRWKSLSNEEQAKYYEEADKERQLHSQQYPNWSSRDNYGKKRKRNRSKAPTSAEASASKPREVTQLAKKQCLTSVQTAVMVPSTSQTAVMVPSTSQTSVMVPSTSQTSVMVPSTSQTSVMVPSTSQTSVTVPSTSQTAVMVPSTSQTSVMVPSTSQTSVMVPFTSQTAVMMPSTSQTSVMVPSTSQTSVMVPSTSQTSVFVPSPSQTSVMVPSTSQTAVMMPSTSQTSVMVPSTSQTSVFVPSPSQTSVMVPSTSQTAVMVPSTSQTAVMMPSTSQTSVMVPSPSQTSVMVPSTSQTAVMMPSTSQTSVMVPSPSQTSVMVPSTSQTAVMVPSTSQTAVMVPSTSQTGVMDPPHTQTFLMRPPHAQTAVTLPVCDICHLSQMYATYLQNSPTTAASTALVSPDAPTETQTLHH